MLSETVRKIFDDAVPGRCEVLTNWVVGIVRNKYQPSRTSMDPEARAEVEQIIKRTFDKDCIDVVIASVIPTVATEPDRSRPELMDIVNLLRPEFSGTRIDNENLAYSLVATVRSTLSDENCKAALAAALAPG